MRRPPVLLLAGLLVSLAAASCAREREAPPAPAGTGAPTVFVSILPQRYFVERVADGRVKVEVMVGPGQSPETYEPTPRQMTALSGAVAYLRIGVPFEEALVSVVAQSLPNLRLVDTCQGVELLPMEADDEHGGERGRRDPHVWLDPNLVKRQAATIAEALAEIDPGNASAYEANLRAFQADLDGLDDELRATLRPLQGRKLLVFHPAFGYFAHAYGLEQVAIESEGKEPGPRRLAEIADAARREGVRVIFVQREFPQHGAEAIAEEIGGAVVRIDPLSPDYLQNLREMARAIGEGLQRGSPRAEDTPDG